MLLRISLAHGVVDYQNSRHRKAVTLRLQTVSVNKAMTPLRQTERPPNDHSLARKFPAATVLCKFHFLLSTGRGVSKASRQAILSQVWYVSECWQYSPPCSGKNVARAPLRPPHMIGLDQLSPTRFPISGTLPVENFDFTSRRFTTVRPLPHGNTTPP